MRKVLKAFKGPSLWGGDMTSSQTLAAPPPPDWSCPNTTRIPHPKEQFVYTWEAQRFDCCFMVALGMPYLFPQQLKSGFFLLKNNVFSWQETAFNDKD